MVDGVDVAEVLMLVVPTLLVAAAVVVVLAYTGAEVATTDEVVTGLTTVHGQLVMVKVVDSVTV
jgi:hypothetical protein